MRFIKILSKLDLNHSISHFKMEFCRKDNISMARNAQVNEDELRKLRFSEQNQRTISGRLTAQVDDLQRKLQSRNLEITELLQKIEVLIIPPKLLFEFEIPKFSALD